LFLFFIIFTKEARIFIFIYHTMTFFITRLHDVIECVFIPHALFSQWMTRRERVAPFVKA
ncbi:MAG: hypothetical protein SXV54_22510, partial [Chloroflexota bacterium]|nr:hypothetical protein [Chloroflexota bacterium]